jgi:DNA repair exonuclease SbcCD ATPase subunit
MADRRRRDGQREGPAGVPPEVAERLYAVPPEGFVAARTEAVAAARAAGDTGAAREIAKLRKPTVAAWLVNLLAIRRPELVAELAGLAGELRRAQRDLRGEQLRELSAQRRAVVGALVAQARDLARREASGLDPHRLPLAEVEATLQAALADEEVAARLRAGRLLKAASYAGFGEVPRPKLRLVTGAGPESVPADRPTGIGRRAEQRKRLAAELTRAETERDRAAAELTRATEAERAAVGELTGVRAELAEVQRQLAELGQRQHDLERRRTGTEHEVTRQRLARRTAERAVAAADRRCAEARAALDGPAAGPD